MQVAQRIINVGIGTLVVLLTGCSGVCPTINCQPKIGLTFQTAIAGAYSVSIVVDGQAFSTECPMDTSMSQTVGIDACNGSGLTISGVDLGHGTNETITVSVSIDSGSPLSVSATLENVVNSRDCPLVCYVHQGTVAN